MRLNLKAMNNRENFIFLAVTGETKFLLWCLDYEVFPTWVKCNFLFDRRHIFGLSI